MTLDFMSVLRCNLSNFFCSFCTLLTSVSAGFLVSRPRALYLQGRLKYDQATDSAELHSASCSACVTKGPEAAACSLHMHCKSDHSAEAVL